MRKPAVDEWILLLGLAALAAFLGQRDIARAQQPAKAQAVGELTAGGQLSVPTGYSQT